MTTITPLHLAIAFVVGGIVGVLTMHALTPDCPSHAATMTTLVNGLKSRTAERDSLRAALGAVLNNMPTVQDSPETVTVNVTRWRERLRPFDIDSSAKYLTAEPQ